MKTEQLIENEVNLIEDAVFNRQIEPIREYFTDSLLKAIEGIEEKYSITLYDTDLLFLLEDYVIQSIDIGYHYPTTIPAIIIPVGEIEETEPSIIDQDCLEDWYINDQGYAYYSIPAIAIEIDIEKLVNEYYELNVKE